MFRNPRENDHRPADAKVLPAIGRPPSPSPLAPRPRKNPSVPAPAMAVAAKPAQTVTPKRANGNILSFFKKAEELAGGGLFVPEKRDVGECGWERYNEVGGSVKRRRTSTEREEMQLELEKRNVEKRNVEKRELEKEQSDGVGACTPPPPVESPERETGFKEEGMGDVIPVVRREKRVGPFIEDEDSDDEVDDGIGTRPPPARRFGSIRADGGNEDGRVLDVVARQSMVGFLESDAHPRRNMDLERTRDVPPLKREGTSYTTNFGDFEGFENMVDFDEDEYPEDGEEFQERQYMVEQIKLEMSDGMYEGELDDGTLMSMLDKTEKQEDNDQAETAEDVATCPICSIQLVGVTDEQASVHVNNCLDGNPTPLPVNEVKSEASTPKLAPKKPPLKMRPARPGQANPFSLSTTSKKGSTSAFTKLMSNHAEDAAWKAAATAEKKSRGKPAYERTCPFYKILPGFSICVDAFRYGAVEGCQAYFLSHFHSDHYIGLTSSWRHGPIYCSRVTGNLVRQQLKVDPKYVIDLEFEQEVEVAGTNGVKVIMIAANHCPGSSLYLFEKTVSSGQNPKMQRVLHCGDFRACRAHLEHPLLRPDVMDIVSGKTRQQKINVCYLDTTYLNPRYAFPSQESVITSCAEMCVSLDKPEADESDAWESMKRERAGAGMVQFLANGSTAVKSEEVEPVDNLKTRGKLLVVVGTYSIGKERICLGIAKALNSKIYASPGKMRICSALEDLELSARLTSNPREAQVHMTPLFEIRPETLDEYLKDFRDTFTRAVAFRPSGWNYKPPNSRFIESPSVATVLHGANWKSSFSMKELKPQRGSTKRAMCFGVPYSEHSSFRELSMFCCALRIEKVIPTVNVGSAKGRERMMAWVERWGAERRKAGLFKAEDWDV